MPVSRKSLSYRNAVTFCTKYYVRLRCKPLRV